MFHSLDGSQSVSRLFTVQTLVVRTSKGRVPDRRTSPDSPLFSPTCYRRERGEGRLWETIVVWTRKNGEGCLPRSEDGVDPRG